MWPAIAGVLFVAVVVLGAYLWLQPTEKSQPATIVYEDDWWPWAWYGPGTSSTGWWPWVPDRHPHRPAPHHPPRHWLGPGGTEWPRPHRLGPGGMAPHVGGASPRVGGMTPRVGGMTPRVGGASPRVGGMTPRVGGMTPRVGGSGRHH